MKNNVALMELMDVKKQCEWIKWVVVYYMKLSSIGSSISLQDLLDVQGNHGNLRSLLRLGKIAMWLFVKDIFRLKNVHGFYKYPKVA